jgi:hypothetical protein
MKYDLPDHLKISEQDKKILKEKAERFVQQLLENTDLPLPTNIIIPADGIPISVRWRFNGNGEDGYQSILLEFYQTSIAPYAYFLEELTDPVFRHILYEFRADRCYEDLPIIKKLMVDIYSRVI